MDIIVTISVKKTFTEKDKDIRAILDLDEDEELHSLTEDQLESLKDYYVDEASNLLKDEPCEVDIKQP